MHIKTAILAALALGAGSLHAIEITFLGGGMRALATGQGGRADDTVPLTATLPQIGSVTAISPTGAANSFYSFTNSPSEANFFASFAAAISSDHRESDIFSGLSFASPIDLHYELTLDYAGLLAQPPEGSPFFAEGDKTLFITQLGNNGEFTSKVREDTTLAGPSFHYSFFSSGTLAAGTKVFSQLASVRSADLSYDFGTVGPSVGAGFWNLKVTHVPDAGSTLMMLGMALCAFGVFNRKSRPNDEH